MKKFIFSLFLTFILGFVFVKNINATTIATTDSGVKIDEEYIYNMFVRIGNDSKINKPFDATRYSYIACTKSDVTSNVNSKYLDCYAFDNQSLEGLIISDSPSSTYIYKYIHMQSPSKAYYFQINYTSGNLIKHEYYIAGSITTYIYPKGYYSTTRTKTNSYTNFSKIDDSSYTFSNNLDFGTYTVGELVFNENLFNENSEFKEVCVNNYDKFGIVSKNYELVGEDTTNKVFSDRDFIWFKHGITGLKTYLYDSNYEDKVNPITEDSGVYGMYATYYWLDSYNNIKNIFTHEDSKFAYMLNEKGYNNDNIYRYYNYSLHPFINYFNNIEKQYMFNVFYFEDAKVGYLDATSQTFDKYCFYVRNEYDIVIFQTNEYGDITGDITILEDTNVEINTTINKNNTNVESKFSGITNFISSMKDTMNFINSMITSFFNAMPLVLREFIIIAFTLLIVILIMTIGGYK